jgi:hypothetical protein
MYIKLNLRFFDGAAAGAAPAATATAAESTAPAQSAATEPAAEAPPAVDRKAEYAKLKAEYKDEFKREFEGQLHARLRTHVEASEKLKAISPVVMELSAKYGVVANDPDALRQAIANDKAYYETEAAEKGLTVDQLRTMRKLEADVAAARAEKEQAQYAQYMEKRTQELEQQTAKARELYPDIDLVAEGNDPVTGDRFTKLLKAGLVDVLEAYELIHPERKNERIQRGLSLVAQMTQQQTLDTVRAKGMRPSENGASGVPSAVKNDPSKWTPEERREINDRVMRGETIDLRH